MSTPVPSLPFLDAGVFEQATAQHNRRRYGLWSEASTQLRELTSPGQAARLCTPGGTQ